MSQTKPGFMVSSPDHVKDLATKLAKIDGVGRSEYVRSLIIADAKARIDAGTVTPEKLLEEGASE